MDLKIDKEDEPPSQEPILPAADEPKLDEPKAEEPQAELNPEQNLEAEPKQEILPAEDNVETPRGEVRGEQQINKPEEPEERDEIEDIEEELRAIDAKRQAEVKPEEEKPAEPEVPHILQILEPHPNDEMEKVRAEYLRIRPARELAERNPALPRIQSVAEYKSPTDLALMRVRSHLHLRSKSETNELPSPKNKSPIHSARIQEQSAEPYLELSDGVNMLTSKLIKLEQKDSDGVDLLEDVKKRLEEATQSLQVLMRKAEVSYYTTVRHKFKTISTAYRATGVANQARAKVEAATKSTR